MGWGLSLNKQDKWAGRLHSSPSAWLLMSCDQPFQVPASVSFLPCETCEFPQVVFVSIIHHSSKESHCGSLDSQNQWVRRAIQLLNQWSACWIKGHSQKSRNPSFNQPWCVFYQLRTLSLLLWKLIREVFETRSGKARHRSITDWLALVCQRSIRLAGLRMS